MKKTILTFAALLALTGTAQAADLTVPHTFSPGTPIKSSDVNDNFTTAYSNINNLLVLLNALKNPGSQFVDNGNGTLTDKLTGLIWLRNPNSCFQNQMSWSAATDAVSALASGGQCVLSDNSVAGNWRLPTIVELRKFVESALPTHTDTGQPFSDIPGRPLADLYWSATLSDASNAWYVLLSDGGMGSRLKTASCYVWPVRTGQ